MPTRSVTRSPVRILGFGVGLILAAYLFWGSVYIYRTSFLFEGDRIFTLWDDGMISMTYARNLALGHGLVWNPGESPVQGYTNLGVTLVMAGLHELGLASQRISLAFQLLNLGLLSALLVGVARAMRRSMKTSTGSALAATSAIALCAPLGLWSLQGADTGFVALWLVVSMGLLAGEGETPPSPRRFWWIAPGIVIRSDVFVLYFALLGASLLWPGNRRGRLWHGVGAGLLIWGGTLLFSLLYYGDPLPNTYYLKASGMPRALMLERGWAQLGFWAPGAIALLLAGHAAWHHRTHRWVLQACAVIGTGVAYHVWVGGDWALKTGGRHLVAVLPPLLVLATLGVAQILERISADRLGVAGRGAAAVTAMIGVSLLLNPSATNREWFDWRGGTAFLHYNHKNYRFASYLRSFSYPTTTVAVHWGGIIPYFSRRPAVDVLGKSDRHIAHMEVDEFKPGHSKYDWDYVVLERKPDILDAVSRGLEYREDLLAQYFRVTTRNPDYAGVAFYLRRDSVDLLTDTDAVLTDAPVQDLPANADAPE